MNCSECDKPILAYPCVCGAGEAAPKPRGPLPAIHHYQPLQEGPSVTMDEALADRPEDLARLKRLMGLA